MHLAEGFVVGGRYTIDRLIAAGSKFRVYAAQDEAYGAGEVAIKVARHDDLRSIAALEVGRRRVEHEWDAMVRLHEGATSAAPLPLELVRMYPADPEVRRVALADRALVRSEPYMVVELADGVPLSHLLQQERLDEERALLIALRVLLIYRQARRVGVGITDFAASNFVVDRAGENVSLVGISHRDEDAPQGEYVPHAFGRLLASVLAGIAAPDWGADENALERWNALLRRRRVAPEFLPVVLGCLGDSDRFDATVDAVENKLRAFASATKQRLHKSAEKARDTAYLIAPGERLADRFVVTKPLGQGGRGFVYRVRDERSDVEVLIKCNKYIYDSGSAFALELPTRRDELEHEYEVLTHFAAKTGMLPQPVAMVRGRARGSWFDLAPDLANGEPYVAMEYIKGVPLLDLLPRPLEGYQGATPDNRLDPRFVLRLMAQIADVLSVFHRDGYLYQDLKPENVLYDPYAENVYMVDFAGACPRVASGELDKKHVAFGVQTHGFAAPEFATLWERSDHRFDIYSLGATAYHLLTGVNPERVALEEGAEYPMLSTQPLQSLPRVVADLVRDCLAPVDLRISSAEEVKRRAELARLALSRSRPLDVRTPKVTYTTEGVVVGWTLPDDPRVTHVRVTREADPAERKDRRDTETIDTVLYDGEATSTVVDPEPAATDARYVVQTSYRRAGRSKHSRGVAARAEACPAPIAFEVSPYFGGVRGQVDVAPHATGLALRWSDEAPPLSPSDGKALAVERGQAFLHKLPAGTSAFYAAFALYDDVASAPRSGSAIALGPSPVVETFEAEQGDDGVRLRWDNPSPELRVRVRAGRGEARWLAPPAGAAEVLDTGAVAGEKLDYRLIAERDGVRSATLLRQSVHRWPEPPTIAIAEGVERIDILVVDALDPRWSALTADVQTEDGTHRVSLGLDRDEHRVSVPGGGEVALTLQFGVDGEPTGPTLRFNAVASVFDADAALVDPTGTLPARVRMDLARSNEAWTGEFTLEWRRDGTVVRTTPGSIAELWASGGPATFHDDDLGPAEEALYRAVLRAPNGDVVADASLAVRGNERLSAPVVTPHLGAVELHAIEGVGAVDVWVRTSAGEGTRPSVRLPHRLEVAPGERVEVAVRRAVAGAPMPWSDVADVHALALPPRPTLVDASRRDGVVTIEWAPIDLPDTEFEVVDVDGDVIVYSGSDPVFEDERTGSGGLYDVRSIRFGLRSEPLRVTVEGVRTTAVVALAPAAVSSAPALRPSVDRLVQCVAVGDLDVLEIAGGDRPRLVVVMDDADGDAAQKLTAATDWTSLPRLLAAHVVFGRRALVPYRARSRVLRLRRRSAPRVRVFEAPAELGRPDWRLLATAPESVSGQVVGALAPAPEVLRLFADAEATPVQHPQDALVVYRKDGSVERYALRTPDDTPVSAIRPDGVDITLGGLGVMAGIGLQTSVRPSLVVPVSGAPDADSLRSQVWVDVARGVPILAAQTLESRWRAPIASHHIGRPSVFHFLKDGRHVRITVGCEVLDDGGTAALMVWAGSDCGVAERTFRTHLGRPRQLFRSLGALVRWIEKSILELSDDEWMRAF